MGVNGKVGRGRAGGERRFSDMTVFVGDLAIDETTVTATAAELNYLDIATLGTGAASKAVVLDASGDYTYPATGTIVYPSSSTLTLQSGSTFNVAGTFQVGGTAVTATAAELNNAADVSARTQELTSTGAVTAGVQSVELNSINSIVATAASAVNHRGIFVIKATGHSDNHTFVFTSGTIDGSNTVALFEADNDCLVLYIDSAGDGTIVENVGSVSLG